MKSYNCDMAKLCDTMNFDDVSSIREYIDQMLQKLTSSAYKLELKHVVETNLITAGFCCISRSFHFNS